MSSAGERRLRPTGAGGAGTRPARIRRTEILEIAPSICGRRPPIVSSAIRQRVVKTSHPTVRMIAETFVRSDALDIRLGGNMSCSRVLTLFSVGVVLVGCEAGRLPTEPTSLSQTTVQPGWPICQFSLG